MTPNPTSAPAPQAATLSQIARKPVRIQRKRTKGWRMPPNTVYVGRPTKWGNPYVAESPEMAEEAVACYRNHFWKSNGKWTFDCGRVNLEELRGKDLACWCKLSDPCHADVLLEIANVPSTSPDEKG